MTTEKPSRFRKFLFRTAAGITIIVVAIQIVPYGRNHENPPAKAEPSWADSATRALFFRACADCHSNETRWPWYSTVAPFSWLVQGDVNDGRRHFNISEWGRRRNAGDEAAGMVRRGEMPLRSYMVMHPAARLAPNEQEKFILGLVATFGEEQ